MDPVPSVPRIVGWLPVIAVGLAAIAALLWWRARRRADDGDGPSPLLAAMPFALLFFAAVTAIASSAAEAVLDSRVGVREASMLGLAILCATPVLGWLLARSRWGAPGSRTFHQQIAANRAGATVLVILLGELLALTGFVVGATFGLFVNAAFVGGLLVAGLSVAGAVFGGLIAVRNGANLLLNAVHARPVGPEHAVLRNVVTELSLAAGMPAPRVFVIEDATPNALALGSDPGHASIAVTTGLLARLDREELQGVIAHELAHVRNLDSRYGMLVAVFVGAVILLGAVFAETMTNWSISGDSLGELAASLAIVILAAIVGVVVRSVASMAALAIQASVSREREFLADSSSVEITRNPAGLIGALSKIDGRRAMGGVTANTRHLWFVSPLTDEDTATEGWLATHPSTDSRISRLRALGAQLDRPAMPGVGTSNVTAPIAAGESREG